MFSGYNTSQTDNVLIAQALAGNKISLEKLVKLHQVYIYNVSLRLFMNPDDALDATQEVLIKMVASLKTFKGESQFRTWLYRIAFNHFLNIPKKNLEKQFEENSTYYAGLSEPENEITVTEEEKEEVRIMCSMAMLMCLSREQRLIYIIGEIFNADHQLGAELFEISPANYRVKLHRAKSELLNFVSGKCGLINEKNPCRCHKKTKMLVGQGKVDKNKMLFNADFKLKVKDLVDLHKDAVSDNIRFEMTDLFRDSPFQIKNQLDNLINDLVA